ncbi:chalcone isomerase [Flavobacterium sp. 316]|uniref:Chalcone isomerase family protein n=1 Tax=Flavobacterium sediminilitoris TaxID=2024526 RepID=A0ABY4HMW4_9FLAO|nr:MULTISPECIES: chalcone isomerase family protein [Flavobacterium]KIX21439.1 chalcone isomerase [Flavobacterium sp. 316]UOX34185.1 chalcone isomerase family protein [Flavobacterium sediminilitoris]
MRKLYLLLMFLILPITFCFAQEKVSGVSIYETLSFGGNKLVLNGAGVKEKMWIDLYVVSLYLPKKSTNADEIINSDDASIIKMNVVSSMVSSEKMIELLDEGFLNATNGNLSAIKPKVDKFKSFFKDEIKERDEFMIVYNPKSGVTVFKNGIKKGTIDGKDFKKALFGVWLCIKPADEKLKRAMLDS